MFKFLKNVYNSKYRPEFVRLDLCTACQLNCVDCFMRKVNYGVIGSGYVKYEQFKSFIDKNPFVKKIEISNLGEVFLNPDLLKILKYAYEKGVTLCAYNGVNFNNVSDEVLEGLVKYKFEGLSLSIDGASNETYSKYRRNGNFDKVIENVKKINEYKKKYNSFVPHLLWAYIIFPYNCEISEIQKAKKMAKELNMTIVFKKDWGGFVPENIVEVEKETNLSYNVAAITNQSSKRWLPCKQLFRKPQFTWNGKLLGCCINYQEPFNLNVFDLGIENVLKSKIVKRSRKMLMGKLKEPNSPCFRCLYYKKMVEENNFIKRKELKDLMDV